MRINLFGTARFDYGVIRVETTRVGDEYFHNLESDLEEGISLSAKPFLESMAEENINFLTNPPKKFKENGFPKKIKAERIYLEFSFAGTRILAFSPRRKIRPEI